MRAAPSREVTIWSQTRQYLEPRSTYAGGLAQTARSLADIARFMQEVEMREGWSPLPDDGRGIERIRIAAKHLEEVGQHMSTVYSLQFFMHAMALTTEYRRKSPSLSGQVAMLRRVQRQAGKLEGSKGLIDQQPILETVDLRP